jgi:oligopeptide transport system substrate-binding protein
MNYGKYSNAEYDDLDTQMNGALALKEKERIQVMKQMESIILGDAAICPLYQLASCSVRNPDYVWAQVPGSVTVYQWVCKK